MEGPEKEDVKRRGPKNEEAYGMHFGEFLWFFLFRYMLHLDIQIIHICIMNHIIYLATLLNATSLYSDSDICMINDV